jgi:hypothetical protein
MDLGIMLLGGWKICKDRFVFFVVLGKTFIIGYFANTPIFTTDSSSLPARDDYLQTCFDFFDL